MKCDRYYQPQVSLRLPWKSEPFKDFVSKSALCSSVGTYLISMQFGLILEPFQDWLVVFNNIFIQFSQKKLVKHDLGSHSKITLKSGLLPKKLRDCVTRVCWTHTTLDVTDWRQLWRRSCCVCCGFFCPTLSGSFHMLWWLFDEGWMLQFDKDISNILIPSCFG